MSNQIVALGLDLGYSEVKAQAFDRRVKFPSVIGTVERETFALSATRTPDTISIPGSTVKWLFGQDAVDQSRMLKRREDRAWIESDEYELLGLAAFLKLLEDPTNKIYLVTGLPVAFYGDKDKVARRFVKKHEACFGDNPSQHFDVETCLVIPQPFGSLLDAALNDEGDIADGDLAKSNVAVIDSGGKTTNLLSVNKLAEIARETQSINLGGWDVTAAMREALHELTPDLDLRDHEITQAVIKRKVKYYGEEKDIGEVVDRIVTPMAQQIVGEATKLWDRGAKMDYVLISGGGALMLGNAVKALYRHGNTRIIEDPIFSNVRGFHKFAQRKIKLQSG